MGSTPFPALIANIPGKHAKRRPDAFMHSLHVQ